jgi:hypothetical protein
VTPLVVLRDDDGRPTRAECPTCGADVDTYTAWSQLVLGWHHGDRPGTQCAGTLTPLGE